MDLVSVFRLSHSVSHTGARIFFFKGGPYFGSHRFTLDSADFTLRPPADLDPTFSSGFSTTLLDCGDMTGTGNHVIMAIEGHDVLYADCIFYVTGRALDDKVDLFYQVGPGDAMWADTLTADHDNLQDVILGLPLAYTYEDNSRGRTSLGGLQVIHGSKKIPVHISDRFGVVPNEQSTSTILLYPNPANNHSTIECSFERSGKISIQVFDILGREVLIEDRSVNSGRQQFSLDLRGLTQGIYSVKVSGSGRALVAKLVVQ